MVLQFLSKKQKQKNNNTNVTNTFKLESIVTTSMLNVSYIALTPSDIMSISQKIKSSPSLKSVGLIGCRLSHLSHIKDVLKAIKRSRNIKIIDFSHNTIGNEGVKAICEVIQLKSNIVEVRLNNCTITEVGCQAIQRMLEYNKKILALDLNSNPIGNGIVSICQGLLNNPLAERSAIQELDMSSCSISDNHCKILGSVMSSCDNLTKLSLADNIITASGVKHLSFGLKKTTNGSDGLEFLDLSGNRLGDSGVEALVHNIGTTNSIKTLYLNDIGMTEKGLRQLCTAMKKSNSVVKLGIAGNLLDDSASMVNNIIDMCSNTSSLKELDISRVTLSKEDIKQLGDFIGQTLHCTLSALCLAETGITDEGAIQIAEALKINMELKVLDVTSNPFGTDGAKAFAKVFKRAKQLKVFKVTGQSRIGIEGENYLAEALKVNRSLKISGASRELDYINDFAYNGAAFKWDQGQENILAWSEKAWELVKRGCGSIISTAIHALSTAQLEQLVNDVLYVDRNVVGQDMFEYVIRHAAPPSIEVVTCFVTKCKVSFDKKCESKTSKSMAIEMNQSDDVSYRTVAAKFAKDVLIRQLAENNRLFLGRYLTENGPAIHQTHEISRFLAKDTLAKGKYKNKKVFVQIYEKEDDFEREWTARDQMRQKLSAAGPFALDDTVLKEVEIHEDDLCISFLSNITDLRHCINNTGVTSGYNIMETTKLAKRAAQCLGTINNLGRIHGDFRPRNFLLVAKKRKGTDPLGKTANKVDLPEKWVVFDLSKSVPHDTIVSLRMNSAYLPPEVARIYFHSEYSKKTLPLANEKMDVWSYGVVLYQLLTGVHLFHTEQNTDRVYKASERLELMNWINLDAKRASLILHRSNESLFMNETSFNRVKEAAVDLVSWCLQGDPYSRPSFNEILSHPFFIYKTHVNYTDLDLLLGWYKKIGGDKKLSQEKNNRYHGHLINSEAADVQLFSLYFKKAGSYLTSDIDDHKLDIGDRQKVCMKSRSLIIMVSKDMFYNRNILQKIMWAKDSIITRNLILVSKQIFPFQKIIDEVSSLDGQEKLKKVINSMIPLHKHLNLKNNKSPHHSQEKWLMKFVNDMLFNHVFTQKTKIIPFRDNVYQTETMMNEIMSRCGIITNTNLKKFSPSMNEAVLKQPKKSNAQEHQVDVLILYRDYSEALETIKEKLLTLYDKNMSTNVTLLPPKEKSNMLNFFEVVKEEGVRKLQATRQVIVLLIISVGFYELFREEVVLLDSARGLVSVVPIRVDSFNVEVEGKEELLNLGLENEKILNMLKLNKSYISLPLSSKGLDLEYETKAAIDLISKETEKAIKLSRKNKEKSENEAFAKYSHTNFFEAVY